MATIVTRAGKGSALTFAEMDANFTNLNNELANVSLGVLPANSVSPTELQDSGDFTMNTVTTTGGIEVGDHVLPTSNNAVDLGSPTKMFRELYLGPDSLYVNGVKVLSSNAASMQFTTDAASNQEIFFQPDGDFRMASTQGDVIVNTGSTLKVDTIEGVGQTNIPSTIQADGFQSGTTSLTANKISRSSGNMEIETATGGGEYIHLETNDVYMGTFASAVRVSDGTVTTAAGDLNLKSVDGNVVVAVDASDKEAHIKIKDAGGTLQTAAEFRDYGFTENATDGDAGTAATVYRPVMDIDHGLRIGSSSANFSSTGNPGNNNTADYNQRGILITNGDDPYWPTVQITSYGGNNPLLDANGSSWAGGLGTRYSSAAVTLAGAGGTESSTTALTSGMRLGQFGFTGHDGDGFGGKGAIASASITVEANEDFESQSIVTIAGTSLGGATPANDATITVTSVGGSGDITGITVSGTAAGGSATEYTNVSGTTTTLPGSGATFDIQDDGDGTYSLTDGAGSAGDGINTAGSGYTSGNGRGARMVFDCLPAGVTNVDDADSTNNRVIGIKFDGSEVHVNPGRSLPGVGDTRFDCDFKVRGSSNADLLKVDAGTEIVSPGGVFQLYSASSDPSSNLANGQMYYNTTSHKFRGYANGAWTDLH